MKIFTLGHSTRSLEEFLEILLSFKIKCVVDVRKFPSSKKFPHFNKENLERELEKNEIEYIHFPELGGYRKEGYENFSKSKEFSEAIEKLVEIAKEKTVAILCAELLWWRCHRRYIANVLAENDFEVFHIFDKERIQHHKLKDEEIEKKMKLKLWCDKKAKKLKENISHE
ncbi:MAG: DUF488 domain-containing protein [Candidatus Aenigmatarchaeota archaeon]